MQHHAAGLFGETQVKADHQADPAKIGIEDAQLVPRHRCVGFPDADGVHQMNLGIGAGHFAGTIDEGTGVLNLFAAGFGKAAGNQIDPEPPRLLLHLGDVASVHRFGVGARLLQRESLVVVVLRKNNQIESGAVLRRLLNHGNGLGDVLLL